MPVNNPRFVQKAWTRGCDFIILDLEDSVPPAEKAHARTLVREAIAVVAKGGAEVFVRINHYTVLEDLEASVWPGLKRINYPKAETAQEIWLVDRIISRLESERGIPAGHVEIGANVETALGVANALEIATASPRIKDFGGGGGYDMSRDLGVEMFVDFDQFVYGGGEIWSWRRVWPAWKFTPHPTCPTLPGASATATTLSRSRRRRAGWGSEWGVGFIPTWWSRRIEALRPRPRK